jgi:hypothetical protein
MKTEDIAAMIKRLQQLYISLMSGHPRIEWPNQAEGVGEVQFKTLDSAREFARLQMRHSDTVTLTSTDGRRWSVTWENFKPDYSI